MAAWQLHITLFGVTELAIEAKHDTAWYCVEFAYDYTLHKYFQISEDCELATAKFQLSLHVNKHFRLSETH